MPEAEERIVKDPEASKRLAIIDRLHCPSCGAGVRDATTAFRNGTMDPKQTGFSLVSLEVTHCAVECKSNCHYKK